MILNRTFLLIGLLLLPQFAHAGDDDVTVIHSGLASEDMSSDPSAPPTLPEDRPREEATDAMPPPRPLDRQEIQPELRSESKETHINTSPKLKGYVESPLDFALTLAYSRSNFARYFTRGTFQKPGTLDTITVGFEWLPITMFGKLGIGLTSGFSRATNYQLQDGRYASVYIIPLEAAVSYHADYFHHQVVVPFVRVGIDASLVKQTSSTGAAIGLTASKGKVLAAGLQLNLGFMEPAAAKALDMSAGINETFLFAEYVHATANDDSSNPNLSRDEWRFGFRFEF